MITNAEFAKTDVLFRKACEVAGTPVTKRQAGKYRNGRGLASQCRTEATKLLKQEGK